MTDVELSSLFSQFEEKAKRLNVASDSINGIIASIEQKLVEANAGLEYWLADHPLASTQPQACSDENTGEETGIGWTEHLLGFTKMMDGWCLACRERWVFREYKGNEPIYTDKDTKPLERATRQIRIRALEIMPEFVQRLCDHTDCAIRAIEKACQ